MLEKNIRISFVGMDPTEALKSYVLEKLMKKENFLQEATSVEVFLKQDKATKGVSEDFRININVNLPETIIRVEQRGNNMYANIDLAMDTLNRRLKRYGDMKEHWSGKKPWKVLEAEAELNIVPDDDTTDTYVNYVPRIVRRKTMDEMSPLEEAEAIERMEMSGYDQYLFKNKRTDKISMLYRRVDGTYGLVEPKE